MARNTSHPRWAGAAECSADSPSACYGSSSRSRRSSDRHSSSNSSCSSSSISSNISRGYRSYDSSSYSST